MNEKNLKPVRSKEEAREKGKRGGKASGEARREKKQFQQAVLAALKTSTGRGTMLEDIVAAQIKRALEGDTRAFEALRDTSGEKPTDKVEASVTDENKELMREYLESVKKGL